MPIRGTGMTPDKSELVERVAEAMNAEYETQMAADNDGSPLPYIDWRKLARAAVDVLNGARA